MTLPDPQPCPFCGNPSRVQQNGFDPDRVLLWWECVCDACDFCGPARNTRNEAVAAWNIRADLSPTNAQIMADPRVRALVKDFTQMIVRMDWYASGKDRILVEKARATLAAWGASDDR